MWQQHLLFVHHNSNYTWPAHYQALYKRSWLCTLWPQKLRPSYTTGSRSKKERTETSHKVQAWRDQPGWASKKKEKKKWRYTKHTKPETLQWNQRFRRYVKLQKKKHLALCTKLLHYTACPLKTSQSQGKKMVQHKGSCCHTKETKKRASLGLFIKGRHDNMVQTMCKESRFSNTVQ